MLLIQTENNFYQLDVLSEENGQVLVRDGYGLKSWTPARLEWARKDNPLEDGSAISIGRPLVLTCHDMVIITSPVMSIKTQA